ncbi:MAG: signal transduction histidine kinase/CheY-like chemotaxis protein [Arenicella sp.]|jgi:signal transduction histidine kinase/CheY-like chemotaxis protein
MDKSIASEVTESKRLRLTQVAQQIHDYRKIAYFCVDQDWAVVDVSDNLKNFGFIGVEIGVDATDVVDFLVGADIKTELELPLLASPSKVPIGVLLLPSQDGLTVVIGDASREFSRRRLLNQKAKENRMLLIAQARLMQKLQSAQKQLHQRNDDLREAARLQSSFMSGVSHEFRTPLAAITGYSDQLQTGLDKLPRRILFRNVAAIQRSSKHLLALVENLLDHGELESSEIELNPRPTNISQLFDGAIMILNHTAVSKGVALGLQLDINSDLLVLVDDSRLRQCLVNLIGNALKFTDQGRVIVRVAHMDDELRISVRDTGIGISPEHLEKVRLPFWQAPNGGKAGTGLGLTITAKIIEMIGGSFSIESTLGEGTTVGFMVSAPMLLPEFVEGISAHVLAAEPLHFLFAEDDYDIASLTSALLEERGVTVTRVANGAEAVRLLGTSTFDLVLLDLHMPVMDGYSAVSAIRGKGDFTPIVVMTASSVKSDRDRAHKLGCDGFLVKPVDVGDLLALAHRLLA